MTNLKNILLWLFTSYFGLFVLSAGLFIIGFGPQQLLNQDSTFAIILQYVGIIGAGLANILTLLGIVFAWIINPIKAWLANRK